MVNHKLVHSSDKLIASAYRSINDCRSSAEHNAEPNG